MNKLLVILAMMVVSHPIFAAVQTKLADSTLQTEVFNTEEKAQQAGLKIIHDLQKLSPKELSSKLEINNPLVIPDSIKINNSELKVESTSAEPDNISFRGLVSVDYQYQVTDKKD